MNDRASTVRPLQNVRAEEAVIGKIIVSAEAYWDISAILKMDHFTVPHHRSIYAAVAKCCEMSGKPSLSLLETWLPEQFDGVGDREAVLQILIEKASDVSSASDFVEDILSAWRERERVAIGKLANQPGKTYEEIRDAIDARIRAVEDADVGKHAAHIGDAAEKALRRAATAHQNFGKRVIGVQTGIKVIDDMIGPLPGGTVVIVAAPSGHGKSGLMSQIMVNNAAPSLDTSSVNPGQLFSMEMSEEQNGLRNLASMTGTSVRKQVKGDFTQKEFDALQRSQRRLAEMPIYILDRDDMNIMQIASECRAARRRRGIRLFGVDHLKLISPMKENWSPVQTVEHATRRFKGLAKELDAVFFLLAQITKEGQKSSNWRFTKADIFGGGLVENADVVLGVTVPTIWLRENKPEEGSSEIPKEREVWQKWTSNIEKWTDKAEVAALKVRDGATVPWREIPFDGARMRFGADDLAEIPF